MEYSFLSNATEHIINLQDNITAGLLYIQKGTTDPVDISIIVQNPDQVTEFTYTHVSDDPPEQTAAEDILITCLNGAEFVAGSVIKITTSIATDTLLLYNKERLYPTNTQADDILSKLTDISVINSDILSGQAGGARESTLLNILSIITARLLKCDTDNVTLTGHVVLDPSLIDNNSLKVTIVSDNIPRVDPNEVSSLLTELQSMRTEVSKNDTLVDNQIDLLAKLDTVISAVTTINDTINNKDLSVTVNVPNTMNVEQVHKDRMIDWLNNPALDTDRIRVTLIQTDYAKESVQNNILNIIEVIKTDIETLHNAVAKESTLQSIDGKVDHVNTESVRIADYDLLFSFETAGHYPTRALVDSQQRIVLSPDSVVNVVGVNPPGRNSVEKNSYFVLNPGDVGAVVITDPKFVVYQASVSTGGKETKVRVYHKISPSETIQYEVEYTNAYPTEEDFSFMPFRPALYRGFFKLWVQNIGTSTIRVDFHIEYEVM